MKKLRAGVIVDNLQLTEWQLNALRQCEDLLDIEIFLNCRNSVPSRRLIKHFFYYVLNFFSMKGKSKRACQVSQHFEQVEVVNFNCLQNKIWEEFPSDLSNDVSKRNLDVIIKFGMRLIKNPGDLGATHGILSFHHGDPNQYRGRPAAFYEWLNSEPYLGIGVQSINNSLDEGMFHVIEKSKIYHHDFSKTLENAYTLSPQVFRKALLKLIRNERYETLATKKGRLYFLPSNLAVLKFSCVALIRKIEHLIFGMFYEKAWRVSFSKNTAFVNAIANPTDMIRLAVGRTLNLGSEHTFQADPFFVPDRNFVLLEALNKSTGVGEIIKVSTDESEAQKTVLSGKHFSFPSIVTENGNTWIFPETASWQSPKLYKLDDPQTHVSLKGFENVRLVDPIYFHHNNIHYIFSGKKPNALDNLNLYFSEKFDGPYQQHPENPIVIDPTCARMGGQILQLNSKLYRVGQDNSFSYGDGLTLMEISTISPEKYMERPAVEIVAEQPFSGPHTLNLKNDEMIFDYYFNKFSIFAGYRRLLSKLKLFSL